MKYILLVFTSIIFMSCSDTSRTAREYYERGRIESMSRQYDTAIVYFSKAIELDPNYIASYNYRALAKARLKQYDAAIADCSKAIELSPSSFGGYMNRAHIKSSQKQYEAAIADYSQAIELDPDNALCYYGRGKSKDHLGYYEAAIIDYSKAIEIDTNQPMEGTYLLARALAKHATGHKDECCQDLQRAKELSEPSAAESIEMYCK